MASSIANPLTTVDPPRISSCSAPFLHCMLCVVRGEVVLPLLRRLGLLHEFKKALTLHCFTHDVFLVLRRIEQDDVLDHPALTAELKFGVQRVRCNRFCFVFVVLPFF